MPRRYNGSPDAIYGDTDRRNYVHAPGSTKAGVGASPNFFGGDDMHYVGAPQRFGGASRGGTYMPFAGGMQAQSAPTLSYDRQLQTQNRGSAPRGPSPQFAASPLGQQRFGAPMMGASPVGPAPMSNMGSLGGYGAPSSPGTGTGAMPGMAGGASSPTLGKNDYTRLKDQHALMLRRYNAIVESDPDGAATIMRGIEGIEKRMFPDKSPQSEGRGMGDFQAIQQAPQMAQPSPATAPRMANPPTATLPMSGPDYQARLQDTYATAGADLDKNPMMGTKPIAAQPKQELTYSNTAAARRTEMAPDQALRNEAAIRGGADRRYNAASGAATAQNLGQMDQNVAAGERIGQRGEQFAGGNFDLSRSPTAVNMAQPGAQPAAQPAQAPVAQAQPAQPQAAAQQQYQEGQILHSPSTGRRFKVVNGQLQEM